VEWNVPATGIWAAGNGGGKSANIYAVTSNYMDCGNVNILAGATSLTIAFWILPIATTSGRILQKWSGTSSQAAYLVSMSDTSGHILAALGNGTAVVQQKSTTNLACAVGLWSHVVVTFFATTTLTIYINGVAATLSNTLNNSCASIASGNTNLQFGYESAESQNPVNMRLEDPRIYNRALTASEVWALYDPVTDGPTAI